MKIFCQAQRGEGLGPHAHRALLALLREHVLVVALPHANEQTVIVGVEELVAGALHAIVVPGRAADVAQEIGLVVAVEVHLVGTALRSGGGVALLELADDVGFARDRHEGRDPVVVAHQFVGDRARLDDARPAHEHGHPERAFPVGVLLRAERRHRAVGPGVHVRPVVARVDDDRVVRDAHVVQRLEDRADRVVVLDHAVDVLAVAVLVAAAVLGSDVGAHVHARRVEPDEEGLARGVLPLHEIDRRSRRSRRRSFPCASW